VSLKSLPLPDDPILAAWAEAMNDAGQWAYVLDAHWRYVFVTDELRSSWDETGASTALPLGFHYFSAEAVRFRSERMPGGNPAVRAFLNVGGFVLSSTPGGREELRRVLDPDLAGLVDELRPQDFAATTNPSTFAFAGNNVRGRYTMMRIDDGRGQMVGVCVLMKPAVGMSQLAAAAASADAAHLERMRVVERPDRRPAAILMADLEASTLLSRRISSAQYFAFCRRLVRTADQCIIDTGGIVGRHAGDGVVAFFLAETAGSESAAAKSSIVAARALRGTLVDIAASSEIAASELSLRFGLHWGATLYMGRIITAGRSEINALGDEVNETARIEACATSGRILASKSLIERLDRADTDDLGLDTRRIAYTQLTELATATDKTHRDASSLSVCEI
jgi:class 3 adenylate cyclase